VAPASSELEIELTEIPRTTVLTVFRETGRGVTEFIETVPRSGPAIKLRRWFLDQFPDSGHPDLTNSAEEERDSTFIASLVAGSTVALFMLLVVGVGLCLAWRILVAWIATR